MTVDDAPAPRTLVICPIICPGGGPPGYTYNLREGLEALQADPVAGATARNVRFLGIDIARRNRATDVPSMQAGEARSRGGVVSLVRSVARRLRIRPMIRRAQRAVERRRAIASSDILVFQGYQDATTARRARRRNKIVVYMPHSPTIRADEERMMRQLADRSDGLGDVEYRAMRDNERALVELADVVVFPTENAAQPYVRAFPEELGSRRVAYILSGVEPPAPAHDDASLSGQTDVLFVGRYVPHKGYDLFVETAERLVRDGVEASFWTLGAGPMHRQSASVTDLGWHDDPHAVIARADIVVVPNRTAYFDLLPLEAAALGRGLVLTEVGGDIDQLERLPDSVGADPRALPEAVLAAIERKRASASWGERNAVAFRREFTHVHMARRWTELIATIPAAPEAGGRRSAQVRRAVRSGDR